MKIKEFVNYAKENNIRLTTSEELELKEINEYYEDLRKLGFYRVFETYYIDEYQCHQFYCIGFLNAQNGYEWLLSVNEDYELEDDLSNLKDIPSKIGEFLGFGKDKGRRQQ